MTEKKHNRAKQTASSAKGTSRRRRAKRPTASAQAPGRSFPPAPHADLSYGLTDAYQAERLVESYCDRLRYDHVRRQWFVYQSPLWRPDPDGQVWRCAIACARTLQDEAECVDDTDSRAKIISFAKFCQSAAGIRRVLGIAQNLPPIANRGGCWDPAPWLLAAPNGVVNLRTGRLRKARPEDLLTRSVGVEYWPKATCPRWRKALHQMFCGETELICYVQRCVGYTLTGLTTEQVWWLLHGVGSNGKSVFLLVINFVLSSYAKTIPFTTVTLPERSIPDDLAMLPGARFVWASEAIEGARLNEARIKALTGGDPITARALYGKWFDFVPSLKLWLTCNYKPEVQDSSHGFWRRPHVISFLRIFAGSEKDKHLVDTLKAEAPGILRWMVLGCLAYQREGLNPPAVVLDATDQYAKESDVVGQFVTERCEQGPQFSCGATTLHAAFHKWCVARGQEDALTPTMFGTRMGDRFTKRHRNQGNVYLGLRLRGGR